MKKIFSFLVLVLALFSFANAADLYQIFQPTFSSQTPSSLYVVGAQCQDNSCSLVNGNAIELYNGDKFEQCWNQFGLDHDSSKFVSCVKSSKINGMIVDLSKMSKIVVKENTSAPFGYIEQFFASGDSYLPLYSRSQNYVCNYDICVNTQLHYLNFEKKAKAIAEIGQINVKNINNKLLPVQIQVPVSIDETVCSAFKYTDSNIYRFQPPAGYSDYSANTLVNLRINNARTGTQYLNQSITIPIEADKCAGLAAFSWTPDSSLENTPVNFNITTDVIDHQVSSSIKDNANVEETIYPKNLTNACWTRAYDFTLANVNTFNLNTSIAQITEGESLFVKFKAGAYKDNLLTPIDFQATLYFNNKVVYQKIYSSNSDLSDYSFDISNLIKNLPAGSYQVKLVTTPIGSSCQTSKSVVETQNLQILAPLKFIASFHIKNMNGDYINGANVYLKLDSPDDYYQVTPQYSSTLKTNSNGFVSFDNLIGGQYTYTIEKNGYASVTNNVHIASNSQFDVILSQNNSAPVIDLPSSITKNFKSEIKLDLENYISDFNDPFKSLTITSKVISGDIRIRRDGNYLILSTDKPNDGKIEVSVTDPEGLSASDTMGVFFTSDFAPVIEQFSANPTNGQVPFNTNFVVNVSDKDSNKLTCILDFGDSTFKNWNCKGLSRISHTYYNVGTFHAKLSVVDGISRVNGDTWIYVFNKTTVTPIINSFNLTSTNGDELPTNLTLNWNVTENGNEGLTCDLLINGENNYVPCIGSYNLNNFSIPGTSRFSMVAFDSKQNQAVRTIEKTFKGNSAPVIEQFSANPNHGNAPLDVNFTIDVSDVDNDNLTCTINFGDSSINVSGNCNNLKEIGHRYSTNGTYVPKLTVTDGKSNPVSAYTWVYVTENEKQKPIITNFDISTTNGYIIPTNITLSWNVISVSNASLRCELSINNNTFPVTCSDSYELDNFTRLGLSTFKIFAIDSNNLSTNRTIERTFYRGNVKFTEANAKLKVASKIIPGKFDFSIITSNETIASRKISVKPIIYCDGVENVLKDNNGYLLTSADSSINSNVRNFVFNTNTANFKLNVPLNVQCEFKVKLKDDFGTNMELSKIVTFAYPIPERKIESIRGQTTDIMNYISSTLKTPMKKGYNVISFDVVNDNASNKDIVVTFTSQNLNMIHTEDLNLGPNQEKKILIPIFIKDGTIPGYYPVRFSVYDGSNKQIRYSYLNVK